jgi:alpha-D-xyloside xylohydrolase
LYYDRLRYRLMPYIYSIAGKVCHDNYTMMRGLVMDFPTDSAVLNVGDQFMFGPSLLVCPVYQPGTTSREIYLPRGGWYNFYSGEFVNGCQNFIADAPYERIPVFAREGAIIPAGPALQYTSEKPADPVTFFVYGGKDGDFELYEDEGVNYNYEKGQYSKIIIHFDHSTNTINFGKREGSFPGMLNKRVFKIILVSEKRPRGFDPDSKADQTLTYDGRQQSIHLK